MAKLGQGIWRQGIAEGVANLTTLPAAVYREARSAHGMPKRGQGIVRQSMAEGVANLTTLPTGWQKCGTV